MAEGGSKQIQEFFLRLPGRVPASERPRRRRGGSERSTGRTVAGG